MLAQTCRLRLTVRVPRGAAGDVAGGVRDVLEDVDEGDAPEAQLRDGFGVLDAEFA
jgi:hypothetical protein